MSSAFLFAMLFGAAGMGYFIYGRKQQNGVALLSGVGLCVFPYFVSNVLLVLAVGAVLMALPFVIRS